MLQLTRQGDYGLRLMLEVGASAGATITTAEVARRQQMPYEFVRKVAQALVSTGLLASERGSRGGLTLRRPAESITVLDIVNAFGPPSLNRCTADPPTCDRRDICPVHPVWLEAQKEVERVLGAAKLSDLVKRKATLDDSGTEPGAIPAG